MRQALLGIAVVAVTALSAAAQAPVPREQPLIIKSTTGSELFRFYCATCHGADAKGRVSANESRPSAPDLTRIAERNNGVFPRERVTAIIEHGPSPMAAHGGTNMPVWGAIFRSLEPNDALVEARIENLVEYLESIQDADSGRGSR